MSYAIDSNKRKQTTIASTTTTIAANNLLLEGKAYHNFVDSLRSTAIRHDYEFGLKKFMRFHRIINVNDLLNQDTKAIEISIIEYITVLKQSGLSFSSRSTYLAAIIGFYTMNDINLNKEKIAKYLGEDTRKYRDRTYRKIYSLSGAYLLPLINSDMS